MQPGALVGLAGADPQPAAVDVVAHTVLDEVADQPLEQPRIAHRHRRLDLGLDRDPALTGFGLDRSQHTRHNRGQVDRLVDLEFAAPYCLQPRQGQQRRDQALRALGRALDDFSHATKLSTSASGSPSVTSSSVRITDNGVRSSWLAFATNNR